MSFECVKTWSVSHPNYNVCHPLLRPKCLFPQTSHLIELSAFAISSVSMRTRCLSTGWLVVSYSLGWVDLDLFRCSTLYWILLRQMGIWQNWLGKIMEHSSQWQIKVNPTQVWDHQSHLVDDGNDCKELGGVELVVDCVLHVRSRGWGDECPGQRR